MRGGGGLLVCLLIALAGCPRPQPAPPPDPPPPPEEESEVLRLPSGHGAAVTAIGLSTDGTRLVTGAADGSVRVASFPDLGLLRQFELTGPIVHVELGGDLVAAASADQLRLWSVADGAELMQTSYSAGAGAAATFRFSSAADPAFAYNDNDGEVERWSPGGQRCRIPAGNDLVVGLAFRPESAELLLVRVSGALERWSDDCTEIASLPARGQPAIDGLDYIDADHAVVGAGNRLMVVQLSTGATVANLGRDFGSMLMPVRVRARGALIVASGLDAGDPERWAEAPRPWLVWQTGARSDGKPVRRFPDGATRQLLADGGRSIRADGRDLVIERLAPLPPFEAVPQTRHGEAIGGLAISPDGRYALSAPGFVDSASHVLVWDLASGRTIARLPVPMVPTDLGFVDGGSLAVVVAGTTALFWEVATWQPVNRVEIPRGDAALLYPVPGIAAAGPDFQLTYHDAFDRTDGQLLGEAHPAGRLIEARAAMVVVATWKSTSLTIFQTDVTPPIELDLAPRDSRDPIALSDDGEHLAVTTAAGAVVVYSTADGARIASIDHGLPDVSELAFSERFLVLLDNDRLVRIRRSDFQPLATLQLSLGLDPRGMPRGPSRLAAVPGSDLLLTGEASGTIAVRDLATGEAVRTLGGAARPISKVAAGADASELWTVSGGRAQRWRLGPDIGVVSVERHDPLRSWPVESVAAGAAGEAYLGTSAVEIARGAEVAGDLATLESAIARWMRRSRDGSRLLFGDSNWLELWELKGRSRVHRVTAAELGLNAIAAAAPSADGRRMLVIEQGAGKDTVRALLLDDRGSVIRTIAVTSDLIKDLDIAPAGDRAVLAGFAGVVSIDLASGAVSTLSRAPLAASGVRYTGRGRLWVSGLDGTVQLREPGGSIVRSWSAGDTVLSLDIAGDGGRAYAVLADGRVAVIAEQLVEPAAWLALSDGDELVITTPAGDYAASSRGLEGLAFRAASGPVPADQLDLFYRRPAEILARLGHGGSDQARVQRRARRVRLERLGHAADARPDFATLPAINLERPPLITDSGSLELALEATAGAGLRQISVRVDGVAHPSVQGMAIAGAARSWTGRIPVPLRYGDNLIEVSAVDAKGVESLRHQVRIVRRGEPPVPALYVLAVGVGDYGDPAYDLELTTEDARDLAQAMDDLGSHYAAVHSLVLLDDDASRERVLRDGRSFLDQAGLHDEVIVFFAGHGLRDGADRYYFGTHGIDLQRPERGGLSMAEIEGLVDGLAARRRVVLLDSCFSGTLEEEVPAAAVVDGVTSTPGKARGLGRTSATSPQRRESLWVAMEAGLADLERGSGAVIIAAAAGRELALESGEWKNGAFTFALLEGLRTRKADRDRDGAVTVAELERYVAARVSLLTGGQQTPMARQDNLAADFAIASATTGTGAVDQHAGLDPWAVAISADGCRLGSVSPDGRAMIIDVASWTELAASQVPAAAGSSRAAGFAGDALIVGFSSQPYHRLDTRGSSELAVRAGPGTIAIASGGSRAAVEGAEGAVVIDELGNLGERMAPGAPVAFLAADRLLLDGWGGWTVVDLTSGTTSTITAELGALVPTAPPVLSPDAAWLAVPHATGVAVRSLPAGTQERLHVTGARVSAAVFDPDGRFLVAVTAGGEVLIWRVDTGDLVVRKAVAPADWSSHGTTRLRVSPGAARIVVGVPFRGLYVWTRVPGALSCDAP